MLSPNLDHLSDSEAGHRLGGTSADLMHFIAILNLVYKDRLLPWLGATPRQNIWGSKFVGLKYIYKKEIFLSFNFEL